MLIFLFCLSQFPIFGVEDGFRGDEIDDRDFVYDEEYFIDILSFSFDKEWVDTWIRADKGYRGTVGSTRSNEFFVHQELKFRYTPYKGSTFRFHFVETEDFDSRYRKAVLGWEQVVHRSGLSVAIQGEVSPYKDDLDVGFELAYPFGHSLKVSYLYSVPDFIFNRKTSSQDFYERHSRTSRLQLHVDQLGSWDGFLQIGRNSPLEFQSVSEQFTFFYEKQFFRGMVTYRLNPRDQIWCAFSGEWTDKSRVGFHEGHSKDHQLERDARRIRIEYLFRPRDRWRLTVGATYLNLDETNLYTTAVDSSAIVDYTEYKVYGGFRIERGPSLALEHKFFVGVVDDLNDNPSTPSPEKYHGDTQLKWATSLLWTPKPGFSLYLNPTIDLDRPEFGGGNVQIQAVF